MKANKRNRSKNEGKTNSTGSTGCSGAGPAAFSRGSSSSVAGTRAGSGRSPWAGVVGPPSGQEMLHRPALAPQLQLEQLLQVVPPLEADTPPGLEQPPGLPPAWSSWGCVTGLKQDLALPPGLVLKFPEKKTSPTCLYFHGSPKDRTQPEPRTHHRTSSPGAVQHTGGLRLAFSPGQPLWVLPMCLMLTPPDKLA